MCCQCHKVEQEGSWAQPATLLGQPEQITHGYCPECYDQALGAIEQYMASQRRPAFCFPGAAAAGNRLQPCA